MQTASAQMGLHETRIPLSPMHTSHALKALQIACAAEPEIATINVAMTGSAQMENGFGESRVRIRRGRVMLVLSFVLVINVRLSHVSNCRM